MLKNRLDVKNPVFLLPLLRLFGAYTTGAGISLGNAFVASTPCKA
jgi:hypothetical protein